MGSVVGVTAKNSHKPTPASSKFWQVGRTDESVRFVGSPCLERVKSGRERPSRTTSALPPIADVKCEKADIGDFMSAFDLIMSAITPKADIPDSAVDVR